MFRPFIYYSSVFIADISVSNIGMSDHLPVFFRRKYTRNKCDGKHKSIEYRD